MGTTNKREKGGSGEREICPTMNSLVFGPNLESKEGGEKREKGG